MSLSSSPACTYSYECRYSELKELSNFRRGWKTTYRQICIFEYMKTIHSITPYELSLKEIPMVGKPFRVDYSNAKRDLRKLWLMKWLDRGERGDEPNEKSGNNHKKETRKKYPYKLSKYSIYGLIRGDYSIYGDESFELCKNLLSNFKDHILFYLFLFPYIEPETLSKLMNPYVLSHIFSYL